ncbi:hypothetical protein AVEN_9812-1 [Araneus ventricosus]|uniref:Uncharacterized protein n=1 Tax=Araneus ventricosus TaxID=182803 RepID=A0A4Y2ENR4_ARAVE|nr:hypothetical protein AVEN_9812-1 [Araneus ventricosus]
MPESNKYIHLLQLSSLIKGFVKKDSSTLSKHVIKLALKYGANSKQHTYAVLVAPRENCLAIKLSLNIFSKILLFPSQEYRLLMHFRDQRISASRTSFFSTYDEIDSEFVVAMGDWVSAVVDGGFVDEDDGAFLIG